VATTKKKQQTYDVVIVGSGHAGAFMAHLLGLQKKRVLIIEAGSTTHRNREDYMENFYLSTFKSPESPYPPNANALDPAHTNTPRPTIQALVEGWNDPNKSYLTYQLGSLPFASTYERVAGGTGLHWMGTSLRMGISDFKTKTLYQRGLDWPIEYSDIINDYGVAETFIGVSSNVADQTQVGTTYPPGYQYPMPAIPLSVIDQYSKSKADGLPLTQGESYAINRTIVTPTPAGRNSVPYDNRRACHGNTNCTPICPIQAKYDAAYALGKALSTGYVDIIYQAVVDVVQVDTNNNVTGLHYLTYDSVSVPATSGKTGEGVAVGTLYVLAASAFENAKILLNSPTSKGYAVANRSLQVGCNVMDHLTYLVWGTFPSGTRAYGYRGPISTAGIESLRDGDFRKTRAPWRIELGNEGWNWPAADPYTTGLDYVYGSNEGQLNPTGAIVGNVDYWTNVNDLLTRQFRCAFLVEQLASQANRITLGKHTDNLGLRRPLLTYGVSEYEMMGFERAREAAAEYMRRLGATQYTKFNPDAGTKFSYNGQNYNYAGAGHTCGTHIMGTTGAPGQNGSSVVDSYQKSWDHPNLYIVGCGSMPSIGTQNPTLTMVALANRTTTQLLQRL
jgi:choline dehydrogenase-like flavoprotein